MNAYIVTRTTDNVEIGRFSVEGTIVRVRGDTFPEGLKAHLEALFQKGGLASFDRYIHGASLYQAGLKVSVIE